MTSPTTINPRELNAITAQFVDDLLDAVDATHRCRDSVAATTGIVAAIQRRDTQHLGGVPADQVHLTDAQWAELERVASLTRSCHRAEQWDD